MVSNYVITVPHAMPPPPELASEAEAATGGHAWDFSALEYATGIRDNLECHDGVDAVTLFDAKTTRYVLDMNRPWARNRQGDSARMQWRSEVRDHVLGLTKENKVPAVIDIHSYPASYDGFSGMDMAVVTQGRPTRIQVALAGYLSRYGGGLVVSPSMSDVVYEYTTLGVPSVMIEIVEGLTPKKRETLIGAICWGLVSCCHLDEIVVAPISKPMALGMMAYSRPRGDVPLEKRATFVVDLSKPFTEVDRFPMLKCRYVDAFDMDKTTVFFLSGELTHDLNDERLACSNMGCKRRATCWCDSCGVVPFCSDAICQHDHWKYGQHWVLCHLMGPRLSVKSNARVGCRVSGAIDNAASSSSSSQPRADVKCSACTERSACIKCALCNKPFCDTCRGWESHTLEHSNGKAIFI